jgi:hypothetical protein
MVMNDISQSFSLNTNINHSESQIFTYKQDLKRFNVSRNLDRTKVGKVYSYALILFSITLSVGIDTTTLSIMTLSITKFIIMTLSITKFSIMILSITKFSIMILSVTIEKLTLSMTLGTIAGKAVAFIYGFQKCNFVELMQE